jgi:hypothetical protein
MLAFGSTVRAADLQTGTAMHVRRLDGAQLDFWIAKASGLQLDTRGLSASGPHDPAGKLWHPDSFHPSTDWTHAAPYLLDDWYNLEDCVESWFGTGWSVVPAFQKEPLKWFMRAYVATHFGEILEDAVSLQH